MAHAIQEKGPFEHVHFSVVHHPKNPDLRQTIADYQGLLKKKELFTVFTSKQVVEAAQKCADLWIQEWARWYSELYDID